VTIRVMIVDDHAVLREAFRSVLAQEPDMEFVGEAADGAEAVEVAKTSNPDVLVMDVGMPTMNGVDATREVVATNPNVKVLALSTHTERHFVLEMLAAGASGYVVKTADMEEMLHAIRKVSQNCTFVSREIAPAVAEFVRGGGVRASGGGCRRVLGPRERQVLALLAGGMTSQQIGEKLDIAAGTVDVHRHNIMRKLDLHSVAELTQYAIRMGLLQPR
jgi:DNA-binding NarL/FixJ family response regulator